MHNLDTTSTTQLTPAPHAHDGHRARLRTRFRTAGLDSFAPHETLELLLTYCIPRINVNNLAHALIDRFGSVSGVLDASSEELGSVPGVGSETVGYLRFIAELRRVCAMEQCDQPASLDTVPKFNTYLRARFVGRSNECVYLVLLDNSLRPMACVLLGEGTVNSAPVTVRRMIELAIYHRAACVVLAHNHPHGLAIPSSEDITVTETVLHAMETVGIPLLEHFIVADHSCAPMLRGRRQAATVAPVIGRDAQAFAATFYADELPDHR